MLDKAEDPRETLDYSYEKQLELLQKVRRGVADVATSRKRVELQMQGLQQQADKLEGQAKAALAGDAEDLARGAPRRSGLTVQLNDLQTQLTQLQDQEEKMVDASQRLQAKVDSFRTKKETIKAQYSAAEAQTKINEAFSGVSENCPTSGWRSSGPKRRPRRCRPGPAPSTNCSLRAPWTIRTGTTKDNLTRELEAMASPKRRRHPTGCVEGRDRWPRPAAVEAPSTPAVGGPSGAQARLGRARPRLDRHAAHRIELRSRP